MCPSDPSSCIAGANLSGLSRLNVIRKAHMKKKTVTSLPHITLLRHSYQGPTMEPDLLKWPLTVHLLAWPKSMGPGWAQAK